MTSESLLADLIQQYDILESLYKVAIKERDYQRTLTEQYKNKQAEKERLRQISQLCWELVNELREADNLLVGEYPDEFSKVFDVANEIKGWLIMEKEE